MTEYATTTTQALRNGLRYVEAELAKTNHARRRASLQRQVRDLTAELARR